jgi:hypothetical protein
LFARLIPIFGIQQLLSTAFVAPLVPAWIRLTLAGLRIAAHAKTRLFAMLLEMLFFLWDLARHSPRMIASTI